MKKVISILIVAALLMSLMVSAFATDSEVPTLTVGSATAEVGDEVTLEVTIAETKYAAYGLQILYDAEALELVSVDPGDEAFDNFLANIDTGKVTDFRARDKSVEGQLFTMTFKVLAAGEHTVELAIDSFNMADQTEVEINAVAGTISVAGGLPEVENPIVIGDNEIELVRGGDNSVEYNFVATETGTLYIAITEYKYSASWTDGAYDEEYDMYDFENCTVFTVNGEVLSGVYFGTVEVVAGEVYTFAWSLNEDCTYGFLATLNLSWTDENIPAVGLDIPLKRVDLPMNTVEIPAGEMVTYLVNAFDFQGYILTITGENFYVSYQMYDYNIWDFVTVTLEPVDGVIELDVGTNYIQEFQIGNSGTEAATVALDCYAPLGGMGNPIIVESLDEVETTIMPEAEGYTYFKWTATEVGTVWVTPGNFYINFENLTKEEYGEYDDTWENYGVYVEPGDEVLIAIGGWVEEETFFDLAYWFEAGYRPGSELNPIEIDLLEPVEMDLYNETVYYTWTPAQSMVVTLNYTLKYTYSDRVPTLVINGEEYTLGAELTVTAGEPLTICASTVNSVYGTLQATVIEIIEEPIEVENPVVIGDNEIELPMDAPEASVYNFVATETGTLYIVVNNFFYESSWSGGEYTEDDYGQDHFVNSTVFTVNGVALDGGFYGSIEVVAGEVYTFSWSHNPSSYYGYKANMNLSYTDENMPRPGVGVDLLPSDLPMNSVVIPAGGAQLYTLSYEFSGYILQIFGENVYMYYESYDWWTDEVTQVRFDPVDGVIEYVYDDHYASEIYIVNTGDEDISFAMDCYAPLGGEKNPIVVENLEDIYVSSEGGEVSVYFLWTSDKLGTITVLPDTVDIYFYNETKDESGTYDSNWEYYSTYVEPGDVLLIGISCYNEDPMEYFFEYTFEEGYRQGSEMNPFEVDLLTGVEVSMNNKTIYYSWTPEQNMVVTLGFELLYTWSSNLPVVVVNGAEYTLGEELTVTAGEPVLFSMTAGTGSVYGTLLATIISVEEEDEVIYEGEMAVETTDTNAWADKFTLVAPVTGTYTFYVPAGLGVWEATAFETDWSSNPYVDYYSNVEGATFTLELTEGEEFSYYVAATTKGEWTITYTVVAAGGEVPGPGPGDEPSENVLNLGTTVIDTDVEYTFTAEADGTLTIDGSTGTMAYGNFTGTVYTYGNLLLQVDGVGVAATAQGVYEMEVVAGQTVTIKVVVANAMYEGATVNMVLTLNEGGEEPIVEGTDLVIGANQIEAADVNFLYTAAENGTLTLTMSGTIMGDVTATVKVNGEVVGTLTANTELALELVAGDEVVIEVVAAGYSTLTAAWSNGAGEEECEHEYVDGVCIHCGEEDPNYQPPAVEPDGTAGNPFIIEELPYTAEQTTNDDLYYTWTATENGTLFITYADGMVALSGSSVGSWEYADGGKTMKVAAGDVITINYWSGTGFTVEFVADSGEAEPGTEGNPIAIDSLNITLTYGDDGIYYAWTATESGEIVIRVAETTWGYGYSLTVNGESLFGAGAELTINVEAGDQIVIMIEIYPSASSDGHLTLEQVVEAPHEHNYVITDSKDATCTEDGYVTYTCECGDTYTETVTATGHNFVDGTCEHCGEVDPDYNPNTGSLNIMALALIAGMSVTAVVVTARKKSDEE